MVIVAVYFYSRRESSRRDAGEAGGQGRVEPRLDLDASETEAPGEPVEPTIELPDADDDAEVDEDEPPPAAARTAPQKIVTLRVVARNRGAFRGDELILCLRGIGLRHGKFGIFHRYDGDDDSATIFSAASLVEPGSFDLSNIKEQKIPGISLFAVLPGPVEGVEAFDLMIAAARAIAQSLDAELLDETGSTLSIQRERYMREEIIQYEHALNVSQ
ncbi:MAG: cell division protein ZipA C-terminal FtsZ-binding domain-containing protein [Woeseiaceae bacterium]|nr:cell division protein ZipA C-terminal FtsZ-binding domain-containing protein [Woeseiaceae bacterium]